MKEKVFCIGANKTGTTSLFDTFKHLEYKVGNQ
jgi:predicted ATPase